MEFDNVTANSWYFYVYNYTSGTKVYITDIEILGYISGYSESQLQVLKDSIESEVSRATAGEDKLSSSIKQNATAITSKVSKGEMGSYITQYYNNVIIAFNKNSKYVQINPGEIAIYNYGVENSKKRAVFDETGNHFYRDGYYVGAIGTNQWAGNNAHKGLVFDLEPQGKYMAFAQKASSSATSYTTMLCFSRANSIYDEYGVNLGCNLIGNWYTLKNFKIGSISAGGYSIFDGKLITAIETVTIETKEYSAVYVDNGGKTFDTTAGSTYLSTSPYYSGWNDNVLGRDGSKISPTSGKEPGMIQGVEFMNGSYLIVSDELWQWSQDANENYCFDCYKCYDQSKVGSAINENYEKVNVPTLVFPKDTAAWTWKYITDNAINDDVLWPEATNASGSGVGVGAGFHCVPAASGVRAAWCFGNLNNGGPAGVPCRNSYSGVSSAYWSGSLGAPGLEG